MAEIPIVKQFKVGRGFNSVTGKVHGTAIEFDGLQPVVQGQGQTKSLLLESITSSRELTEQISFNASASVNQGNWGGAAGYMLTELREINNYSTYALIRAEVKNPPLLLQNPRLKEEARVLLNQQGWDEFTQLYGWEYFEGYISGGSYFALIEIQTRSELQQRNVKEKLSGFYGPFGVNAGAEAAFKQIAQSTSVNVLVYQSGGEGDPFETTLETMLDQARSFPELALNNPVPIIGLTSDYKSTIRLPAIPSQNSLARIQQKNTLEDLGRKYLKLRDYKSNIEFILDNFISFDEFRGLEPQEIIDKRKAYSNSLEDCKDELDNIVKHANDCTLNIDQCKTYASVLNLLPLPTIEGDLMNLKQLEDKLNTIVNDLELVKQGKLQAVDTSGDINFGPKITSNGRMHVNGPEFLYLLNKDGVIVGQEWGGSGNLLVEGEIRGKLWYSEVFTLVVPGNGTRQAVRMYSASKCIAFITSVSGSFQGGGEKVWVEIGPDGFWYLCGIGQQPGISVEARCAGMP